MARQNGVMTELRSRSSGRDSNAPTSGRQPGALPDNRPTPARSRFVVMKICRGRGNTDRTALPTELPEHECSGRDSNPRPVD
jgi:hypothetical protein